jgi:hypothetical protein
MTGATSPSRAQQVTQVRRGVSQCHTALSCSPRALSGCFGFCLCWRDYGWERKKRFGLDVQARSAAFCKWSEQTDYELYSWIRYLVIMLLTYVNTVGVIAAEPESVEGLISLVRLFWTFSVAILFSIILLAIDRYLDRSRRRGLNRIQASFFWSYFWLRHPALILVTLSAAKRGLQP